MNADHAMTPAEVSEIVGDDIAYWLGNRFMDPDMLADKVAFWVSAALEAERERIAQAIEAKYLGPDSGRGHDGREAPDAHCRNAHDEGLELAAGIARKSR